MWTCWPRIDGDPVFCALVDGDDPDDGFFSIGFDEAATTAQSYVRNTAIVRTVVTAESGASFAITDFVPRFRQHGRSYRPSMIVRQVEPLDGLCRIRVRVRPRMGYGKLPPPPILGSNHIRYVTRGRRHPADDRRAGQLHRQAKAPSCSRGRSRSSCIPTRRFADVISRARREFHDQTRDYWLDWVRNLNVPYEWQEAVIRAAITLQLCSFEETGAIVAALTTSIPEAPQTERNWDYRYCWIRDAFFTVHALNRVGATHTMERFIEYVTNVIALERRPILKPVYAILPEMTLEERLAPDSARLSRPWPRAHRQRRRRSDPARRLRQRHPGGVADVLRRAAAEQGRRRPVRRCSSRSACCALSSGPHARCRHLGISRPHAHPHPFGRHVLGRLRPARAHRREARSGGSRRALARRRPTTCARRSSTRAWNAELNCFTGSLDTDEIDASVLLLHELGIVAAADPRFVATVETIGQRLGRNGHLLRYAAPDDFGAPSAAFTICTFWYVDALAAIGRRDEARRIFEELLARRNHVGLLSEDIDPATGELWGNFPQTYSMVGIIVAAMRLSKGWEAAR